MRSRGITFAAATAALAVAAGVLLFAGTRGDDRAEAVDDSASYEMSLDATPGGSVDTVRTVNGTAVFNVSIKTTEVAGPYKGYAYSFEWDPGVLTFPGPAVENTAATGLDTCNAGSAGTAVHAGFSNYGNGAGCISFAAGLGTTFAGDITTLPFQCVADGTSQIFLIDLDEDALFGSTLNASTGEPLITNTTDITITCTGTGGAAPTPTNTPLPTSTATPGNTNTPTATFTPCVGASCPTATRTPLPDFTRTTTPTGTAGPGTPGAGTPPPPPPPGGTPPPPPPPGATATQPGGTTGGAGGGPIQGPDTGSGGDAAGDASSSPWLLLGAIAVTGTAGAAGLAMRKLSAR